MAEETRPYSYNPPKKTEEIIPVFDREAFAAKHLPDLGYDVKEFRVFHWTLHRWKELERRLISPEFDCGGHRWRLLLFPFGNPNVASPGIVSAYLESVVPKDVEEGWHVCVQFALAISNPDDSAIYTTHHAHHRFIPQDCVRGFANFGESYKLFNPQPGQDRLAIDDSAVVSVYVRVLEDPTGLLWDTSVSYNSQKEIGYVGLKLRGATSYMNTLLQSLFFTHSFRKAVYQIPIEDEHPTESTPLALQQVFYRLQTCDQPVYQHNLQTRKLRSPFLPHDGQQLNRLLLDKLESKLKGTRAEGAIAKLFVGTMKSSVKCVNAVHESSGIDEFYDIQLKVKGMKTLCDSFRDYVAVELLEGEKKCQSLPPVLHLQLKRYEYNSQLNAPDKINGRFEFPFEIDLEEFLDVSTDRSKSWNYKLHSVLVHSGDFSGGKFFAFIKPHQHSQWFKFDDDLVTPATDYEVLEENYGGEQLNTVSDSRGDHVKKKRLTTAYMLVYIRESAIDEVLTPLSEEDIPSHLKRRFNEQLLSLTATIVTDETFARHEGFDLAVSEQSNWPPSNPQTLRAFKKETYSVFKSRVARRFGYHEDQVRLWTLVYRQNRTVRLGAHILEDDASLMVEAIDSRIARQYPDLWLYLEILPDPSKRIQLHDTETIIIFLKHFNTTMQSLYGIGSIHMPRAGKVGDLIPIINEKMKWAPGTPLKLYEEVKPGMIELLKPKYTFALGEIQEGDIICFQVDISDKEVHDIESQGLCSNPRQFYDLLQNRVVVLFRPKFGELDAGLPKFSLVLNKKQDYNAMASAVGEHLKHEPIKLRFTTAHARNGRPETILKRSLNQSVAEIIAPPSTTTTIILYEKLHVSIVKLETKRSLKVVWTGIHNKEESTHLFLSSETSVVRDLTEHLSKRVQLTPTGTGMIRVFEVEKDGKTRNEFIGTEMIGNLPDPVKLFAEEIPQEELDVKNGDKVINVFHFTDYVVITHGIPFKFVVKHGEKLSGTKERLQRRLGVSNDQFSRLKFALVGGASPEIISYFKDVYAPDDIIHGRGFHPKNYLGLDHTDMSGKSRGVNKWRIGYGTMVDSLNTIEIFAEEIPQKGLEAEDYETPNDFYFTRDVARTLGISLEPGFAVEPQSPQELQAIDGGDRNARRYNGFLLAYIAGVMGAEPQQYKHEGNFPPTTILSRFLRDPEPEVEWYINEIDNTLGNHTLPDRERRWLLNELCKKCSRHRTIPKSMLIPDCWKDSVEVEHGCSADVSQSTYQGHRVAVKTFRVCLTSDLDVIIRRFYREGVAWKHLRHPNILPLLGVTVNEHRIALVSEWMENGNINQFIRKDPHANRPMLLVDIANGVKYLHDLRIVHGDLKGANILINKYQRACIADFGLVTIGGVVASAAAHSSQASLISNDSLMSFTAGGTYRWMSPELLYPEGFGIPEPGGNRPTRQSDCYAFGMVIYEVLCGHHPYVEIQSDVLVVNAIIEGVRPEKPEEAALLGFTEDLWGTLVQCWLEDRSGRPSVDDVLAPLNDATICWDTRKSHNPL